MNYHSKLDKKFPHGIMFHHFHDNKKHKKGQGTISKHQLIKIIKFIGRENILDADQFLKKFLKKKLKNTDVCFSFDDCNPSQYDVASPVLAKYKIKAFFFIITSPFIGDYDKLELYRFFRINYFKNIDTFYKKFYNYISDDYKIFLKNNFEKILYKKRLYPHYTIEDINFRLVRDEYLKEKKYNLVMFQMFKDFNFEPQKFSKKIFISKEQVIKLEKKGHMIGLHSHNHPTNFISLNYDQQFYEYKRNRNILSKILKKPNNFFQSMSHPCGKYDQNTLNILNKLKIKIGFIERMNYMKTYSNFRIPRQDHSDIISMI